MTEFQDGTLITMEVMGCRVHEIGKAILKTPFRRSGHNFLLPTANDHS